MELFKLCLIIVLIIAVLVLGFKIYRLKKSVREVDSALSEKLENDTNTLIAVSTSDKDVINLASHLNHELKTLNAEKHRYYEGDRELKNAVTNISHDLRTPLTAICGYVDLLENEEMTDNAKRYTAVIKERAYSLNKLTEELFRYSVILSDEQEMSIEKTNINYILEESIIAFLEELSKRSIKPKIIMPEKAVFANTDASALKRIFSNILSNAVKYSDGDLRIELTSDNEILFTNTAKNLSKTEVGRLFDRFYTVESARKSTGLGLSIARHLANQLGAEISAEYKNKKLTVKVSLV